MKPMKELIALNQMALMFFDRLEYATFIDLMEKLRDRASEHTPKNKSPDKQTKKYSYDIEVKTEFTTYKNNHKGERMELSGFDIQEVLIKTPLGEEPQNKIEDIKNSIQLFAGRKK